MYSRRDFGKLALASLPLSMAFAKGIDSKIGGVQFGVQTYSFRQLLTLKGVIDAMVQIGLGQCEIWSAQVEPRELMETTGIGIKLGDGAFITGGPSFEEMTEDPSRLRAREALRKWRLSVPLDYFKAIRAKFEAAGISVFAYKLTIERDFTEPEIERAFQMTEALGARVLTVSSRVSTIERALPYAEKYRITIGLHGHFDRNYSDPDQFESPEQLAKGLAMSKWIGVNLDLGHFTASNNDAVKALEAYGNRITNLHLKDRKKDYGPNVPFGEGDTPLKAVLLYMQKNNCPYPAHIEYEYQSPRDCVTEVKRCYDYCKRALSA